MPIAPGKACGGIHRRNYRRYGVKALANRAKLLPRAIARIDLAFPDRPKLPPGACLFEMPGSRP